MNRNAYHLLLARAKRNARIARQAGNKKRHAFWLRECRDLRGILRFHRDA